MKYQILFSGKNKKNYYQSVVFWISQENGKSALFDWT